MLASCGAPGDSGADQEWPEPSPALWEVTAPDGQKAWLFGTIHSLPDGVEWRTDSYESALASADILVVEIADLGQSPGNDLFNELAETPGQLPLSQRVEASERPALLTLMDRAGADDGDFSETETWAAALILASSVREGDPENGVDRSVTEQAAAIPLGVQGLETREGQLALFDNLSSEAQSDLLYAVAQEAQADLSQELRLAWFTGDLDRIEQQANSSMMSNAELKEVLQTRRNEAWAAQIDQLTRDGWQPFVAVGAAHMAGPDGLPALLEARGFTVRRIQ